MKPPVFSYLRPSTLGEALSYLSKYSDDSKIISGGQSLIPTLNMRLSTPEYLIDISRIDELNYIKKEDNYIVIGALTKQYEIENSSIVKEHCPLLIDAIKCIGNQQIRNRGTIGGSVAHADPSAEISCVLAALRGEIVIVNEEEEYTVTTDEFFLTYMLSSLDTTEMIKKIKFPVLSKSAGYAFFEKSRRKGDFALVGVAAVVELDNQGLITSAKIAIAGVNPVVSYMEEAEDYLIGKQPTKSVLTEASEMIRDDIEPEGDIHGSETYRKELAVVITNRALQEAVNSAKGDNRDV